MIARNVGKWNMIDNYKNSGLKSYCCNLKIQNKYIYTKLMLILLMCFGFPLVLMISCCIVGLFMFAVIIILLFSLGG